MGWESMQVKRSGGDWLAAVLTAKYCGLKFHYLSGPLNGYKGAVDGFTPEDNCCVPWKLNEGSSEKPMKGCVYKYCILLFFPGYDINQQHDRQHQKYWSLQELYKDCDVYIMVGDHFKQHPEKAEEMDLKIYWNDVVIDEVTEVEAVKTGE